MRNSFFCISIFILLGAIYVYWGLFWMDFIDRKIIHALQNDSRTSFLSIAAELKMSEAAIRQRVKKMRKKGEIKKFTIETKFPSRAIVAVATSSKVPTKIIIEKMKNSNIQKILEVTGDYSLFATIGTENSEQLNDVIEMIRSIAGVVDTKTFTILKDI